MRMLCLHLRRWAHFIVLMICIWFWVIFVALCNVIFSFELCRFSTMYLASSVEPDSCKLNDVYPLNPDLRQSSQACPVHVVHDMRLLHYFSCNNHVLLHFLFLYCFVISLFGKGNFDQHALHFKPALISAVKTLSATLSLPCPPTFVSYFRLVLCGHFLFIVLCEQCNKVCRSQDKIIH